MSKKDSSLGLAITSVGDLLLNKTITKNQENKEINSIDLVIPNYQRPYKWTAKNVIQFIIPQNVKTTFSKSLFS